MEGTSSNRAAIDIGATGHKHKDLVPHLLGMHALTGCDTVSYMYGIGKITGLNALLKGHSLEIIGSDSENMEDILSAASEYVACCYGCKLCTNLSDIHFNVWLTKTGRKTATTSTKLKSLPPTSEAFEEHVKRAHFQTAIWKYALHPDPPKWDPTKFGWCKHETSKSLVPVTVADGVEPAPPEVLKMIRCGCSSDEACSAGKCGCNTGQLSCSQFCTCQKLDTITCHNRWTKDADIFEGDDEDEQVDDDNVDS